MEEAVDDDVEMVFSRLEKSVMWYEHHGVMHHARSISRQLQELIQSQISG